VNVVIPARQVSELTRAMLRILLVGVIDGFEEDAVVEGPAVGALGGGCREDAIPGHAICLGDGLEDF
jgi:hypothetical protein